MKIFNLASVYKSSNRLAALKGLIACNSDLHRIGITFTAMGEYKDSFISWLIENGYVVRVCSFDPDLLTIYNPTVPAPNLDVYNHKGMFIMNR